MMTGVSARLKRVTDPLADKVKARIVGSDRLQPGYASSGSEHSAQADDEFTSSSLSELFYGFGVDDSVCSSPERDDSFSDRDPFSFDLNDANVDSIKQIVEDEKDTFQKLLRAHVLKALQLYSGVDSNKQILRRNVMAFLRNCGYNAAICKTKWETCGGLTAGNYEFIDVVPTEFSNSVRYFVDLDFAAEFEIARPSSSYERLVQYIPSFFVGKCEDLKQILKAASDAAKRSLKSKDLLLPPWRKHRFMQNKWLGPYRRTTNVYQASLSSSSSKQIYGGVLCRAVGFDVNVNGGHLPLPAIARTR